MKRKAGAHANGSKATKNKKTRVCKSPPELPFHYLLL
jgi:hypothetical protein